jgi:hypothetical protein
MNSPPVIIFVDDLDRCSPEKVADVFEGINLFLAGQFWNCIFVIGMDPEIIAAALDEEYSKVVAKIPKYSTRTQIGWQFMDKFVQLPFVIPPPEERYLNEYIEGLLSKKQAATDGQREHHSNNVRQSKSYIPKRSDHISTDTLDHKDKISQFHGKEEAIIRKTDEYIDTFRDDNPKIRELILVAAKDFSSNNPRELKRFMNIFRFQYFIWATRKSLGFPVSSLEQITSWIILSLKWPEVVRWLQWGPSWVEYGKSRIIPKHMRDRLKMLEDLGHKCNKENLDWQTVVKSIPELDPEKHSWITDEGLGDFFKNQGNLSVERRLSASKEYLDNITSDVFSNILGDRFRL